MVNKVRTIDFLPEIFRTETNRQFLNASLDVITDQPNLRRVEGFIGEKYGYGIEPGDKYVVEPTKSRRDYQFDPAVIFLKKDTSTPQDFINYPGILNALKNNGGNVVNHDRLFNNEFYSWDPFVDYDKLVNYSQYYWIPNGPDPIPISSTVVYNTGTFTVAADDNGYQFDELGGTNPSISLLRGGTYNFVVGSGFTKFWIQTIPGVEATAAQRNVPGVTDNGTDNGSIEFVVPDSTTLVNNILYYQSGSDPNSVGIINLIESNTDNTVFISDILGKKTYTSPNGIKFTNGLKVIFGTDVFPQTYADKAYYVEGVGTSIELLPVSNYIAAEITGEVIYNPWDFDAWDIETWDLQLYVPVSPEYITISRKSRDYNAWTRSNRWFHEDVINTTVEALGYITRRKTNTVTRAQRPIIEYRGNLKLFNSGIQALGGVNILDTFTQDAFSEIEGKTVQQVGFIDGLELIEGTRIIFAADTNPAVRKNIYTVTLVPTLNQGVYIINLVPDTTSLVEDNSQVYVYWVEGVSQAGSTWWFSASDNKWYSGQKKTILNQYPLYDIFNATGSSLNNNSVYDATTFNGSKLFSFTPGDGPDDPILGFPIAYSNIDAIGDILFTVNINEDTFNYNKNGITVTENVNIGFVHWYETPGVYQNLTGWVTAAGPSFQYQVFEFPIIQNLTYSASNVKLLINDGGSGYAVGDELKITGNQLGGTTPENDLTFKVESTNLGRLIAVATESFGGNTRELNQTFLNCTITSLTGTGSSALASVVIKGPGTTEFTCDVLAKQTPDETPWKSVAVYYNDNLLDSTGYVVAYNTVNKTTSITVPSTVGSKITVLIISDDVSKTAYYQTPSNLENNPFNTNITSVALGDIKNQYRTIFTNAPELSGQLFGNNNFHDLPNLNKYGTSIIQNSASLVLPGLFLRKPEVDLYKAIQFNADQYQIYKTLLIDLAAASDFNVYMSPLNILDDIIYKIGNTKNQQSPFFWSDMIFSGNPYVTNTYSFGADVTQAIFTLNPEVWSADMYSVANYRGIGVYLTRKVQGRPITIQLLKDIDYTVSVDPGFPNLVVNYDIKEGDTLTINEYNQTYASYCPSTPSKLGLYPIFTPAVIQPLDTDQYYILGHDGSYNKLYGSVTIDPLTGVELLNDFRDQVLLEFEKRVYNNFKVAGEIPLAADDVVPGQFRKTEYSWAEILEIYSPQFLNWIGATRLDYKSQYFRQNNQFTYNYNQSSNKIDSAIIKQGYWKGIYNWLYDTINPALAPWEMLGLINKPDWWDTRYGPAPYTSGNTYMWSEIAEGYVWNDGQPYVIEKRARPGLLGVLPVDSYGNMVSPLTSIVGNYNSLTFNNDWVVGDGAPVEASYLKNSQWPFDLMRLLALTKPAKFFNLFVDRDNYKFNDQIVTPGQYLYNGRYHLDPTTVQVYGNGVAKHSYINWIVDYNYQRGANGQEVVTNLLQNLDVRLTYSLAGFSAKNYLKFLVEKATPNSKNTSLLIPDENYSVLLYDNPPQDVITYSSVIVQKTEKGFTVWGNTKNVNYFTILTPKAGFNKKIVANTATIQVAQEYYPTRKVTVPYGTQFYSTQAVGQFLYSYGQYLIQQGVVFNNIEDGTLIDWSLMIQEFLVWASQGWETGSIISLNPAARKFVVNRTGLVPQPLTLQNNNFLLNQNLVPIQSQDICVNRENEALEVKVLSPSDTIALANIHLSSIEHAIVFDNTTSFNDVIYNLTTGLRQPRLLFQGYKTGEWSGYINTSGFILNENNVKEWQPNVKYPKNIIVLWKNNYYTARKLIEPTADFNIEDWLETDYGQVKSGLLPNPSTVAYESQFYYDTNRANLENDVDLLSFSLIGFRPRDYLTAADLSDITQINVYKNIVKYKGTKLLTDSFRGTQFNQGSLDYQIDENWAVRIGDFGSILNNNYIEAQLNQPQLTGNPTLLGFAASGGTLPGVQQVVPINELVNFERPPLTPNFLPVKPGSYTNETGLPPAGYVNLGDSKLQKYYYADLSDDPANLQNLYRGNYIWIANYKNNWEIFTAVSLNNQVIELQNNFNGTSNLTFQNIHSLKADDTIAIINFSPDVDGFYTVLGTGDIYTITIPYVTTKNTITGLGSGFNLVSQRFEQASDAAAQFFPDAEWSHKKIWVDYGAGNQWEVWGSDIAYKEKDVINGDVGYGTSVAYTPELGKLVIDGLGKLYRYWGDEVQVIEDAGLGLGAEIVATGVWAFCSSPDEGVVHVYKLNESVDFLDLHTTIVVTDNLASVTGAIAVSKDAQWLYVADALNQEVAIYNQNNTTELYIFTTIFFEPTIQPNSGWGTSLATSTDGVKIIVGAPYEDISSLEEAGAVYVYTRRVQRYYADGATTAFALYNTPPSGIVDVLVNDAPQINTFVVSGNTVNVYRVTVEDPFTLLPVQAGSIITVGTGYVEFVQRFQSDNPHLRGWYGLHVDTNRYGADFIAGAPFEVSEVNSIVGVEGAAYRYTNAGQRYGVITTTITGTVTGVIFVDGYQVNLNGNVESIRDAINTQTPTNIIATNVGSTLTITVKENTPEVLYNVLDITGPKSVLTAMGITLYTKTQVFKNPNLTNSSGFGYNVKMDEQDSLLISAVVDRRRNPTTFDYTTDCVENDTIFDNDGTVFVDQFHQQGVVYMYDYLPAYAEGIDNPGQYAFGQYISTSTITAGTPDPRFGYSLSYSNKLILVGTPYWRSTGGGVGTYTTDWIPPDACVVKRPTAWYVDKRPLPVVDINSLNNVSIYNGLDNQTLDYLDYIDPLQGKLLGPVQTNLDHFTSIDPAIYGSTDLSWSWNRVGQTWLDLNTIRILNYHQPDYSYNAKNWGRAFPGSTADIYTWVESTQPPLNYGGPGQPLDYEKYTSAVSMDDSTNSLVTHYYFWVKNYPLIPNGKNLSPLVLSTYLINPLNSGLSFIAPITTNVVGIFNSSQSIQSESSILHLGYGLAKGEDEKHTSWQLVREGNVEDFLPGLPTILGNEPSGLYLKFLESFSGWDSAGNEVPDPRLPELVKYGTSFQPRQSMFINRLMAIKNYIDYANEVLIKLPITEIRNFSLLNTFGPSYDTRKYWYYVNWWADGYNNDTKPVLEVNQVSDLQTLLQNQLLISVNGTNITLFDGLIVKVKKNKFGKSEYYSYQSASNPQWVRIGVQDGTIQISETLYGLYGWDSEAWGLVWDKNPSQEITYIIRWLCEQCYIDDLSIERNKSLIIMFEFMQSESLQQNNYMPWLTKTSLVDVKHRIRNLLPYKKYQRDNQEFLSGFINEIKPYHVVIKDFIYSYEGLDTYFGNLTDFDLPAQWNPVEGKFESPQLVYSGAYESDEFLPGNIVWDNANYNEWYQNYGLSINTAAVKSWPVTKLVDALSSVATSVVIQNTFGLPAIGTITIGAEQITYDGINQVTNTLFGLTRGVNGTLAVPHAADSEVLLDIPPVIVYNTGRGYVEPPRITVEIDTSIYPEPRIVAELEPVMAGDRLMSINVINPGAGYAVMPEIVIQGSSIVKTASSPAFNTVSNTITIPFHGLISGDPVIYTVGTATTAPSGLRIGNYYYIRVIDANTVALYENYDEAVIPISSPYLHVTTNDGRVQLLNSGSGFNHIFTVTARAYIVTNSLPIREFDVSIKFDRTSYLPSVKVDSWDYTPWDSFGWDGDLPYNENAIDRIMAYYQPTLSMPGKNLPQLMTGVDYPNAVFQGDQFVDGWDYTPWDIFGWNGPMDNPVVDTNLISPDFNNLPTPRYYDEDGNPFLDNYGPEELVAGYVTDMITITVTSNDISPDWTHVIMIDQYGQATVFNNSGDEVVFYYYDRWWYGTLGSDPATDPAANTPMSTNGGIIATFLRS